MVKKDERRFFRVHDGMPEHPKIEGLSDGAFRLLLVMWAWCRRNWETDGHVPEASWRARGSPAARKQLIAAGLAEQEPAGVLMHDWDEWQETAEEIRVAQAKKKDSGAFGAHKRWHLDRGKRDADCEFCTKPTAIANG